MNVKPGIGRAKRMMMARRKPIATLITEQQARLTAIDERIGKLMGQRADLEETLADLYALERGENPT